MNKTNLLRDERAFVVVLLGAGLMLLLCAVAGLAIDVGRAYVVRSQLQNAADATALAGAGSLYLKTKPPTLSWSRAETAAGNFIGKNSVDGKPLTDGQVETGYWNLSLPSSQPLQPQATIPGICSVSKTGCTNDSDCPALQGCLQMNVPAVKVTISKSPGNNGGPVQTFFAKLLGWKEFQPTATAVALSGYPGVMPPGVTFPFAITQCLKDDFLNGMAGGEIELTSVYHTSSGDMLAGQWTDLQPFADPSASLIKSYIDYLISPNDRQSSPPPAIKINDTIYIDPGTKDALYKEAKRLITAGDGLVFMPVVDCNIPLDDGHTIRTMTVKGFVGVQLTNSDEPKFTLKGTFMDYYPLSSGPGAGGETTNAVTPPKLVR